MRWQTKIAIIVTNQTNTCRIPRVKSTFATTVAVFHILFTSPLCQRALHSLDLLGLENRVQEATEQADDGECTTNERAHAGDELVETLSFADNRHGHGRQVVREACLGSLSVLVLQ